MRIITFLLMIISTQALASFDPKVIEHLDKNEPTVIWTEPLLTESDPISSGSMQANWINRLLFRPPFYISNDGKVKSEVLKGFYYDRSINMIVFEISNVEFSDGSKIEAIDIAYSILRVDFLGKRYAIFDKIEGYQEWKNSQNKLGSLPKAVNVSGNTLKIKLTDELKKPFNDLGSLDFSIVPHSYLDKDTLRLENFSPTSGGMVMETISQNLYRFTGNNEVISIASVPRERVLEIMPYIKDNHTVQIDEITLPPQDIQAIQDNYDSFSNINKRVYGVVLDNTKSPFDDPIVREYFIQQHRKTIAQLYGEDFIEGSVFSRVSPGYLPMEELSAYRLTEEQEEKCKKYLQENPPYFRVNLEKQGSKLVEATLTRLNIEPRFSTDGYASIRWFNTGFEVYDLVNDLREVFTPGRYSFLNLVTEAEAFQPLFDQLVEGKWIDERFFQSFNRYLVAVAKCNRQSPKYSL